MGPEPFSWSLEGTLELGERVQAFSDAEVQIGQADFRAAKVVLTNRRLLILLPMPGGTPVVRSFERHMCVALQNRERNDGSMLVALKAGGALIGLVFQRWHRDDATPLLGALGVDWMPAEEAPSKTYVAGAM